MAKVEFKTLARSSVVAWLAEAWRIGSRFVLTPIVLSQIGTEGYGVWTLVFSLSNYVSMVNASFGVAYVKATAECLRTGERDRLERVLGSGMVAIGGVALLGLAATWLLGDVILAAINVPPEYVAEGKVALLLVMFCLVLRMSLGCALEVLGGLQRFDLAARLSIVGSIVEFCVTLPLLYFGFGLVGMGVGYAVGQTVTILSAFGLVKRHAPGLRISPRLCSRAGLAEVFSVGGRFQLLGLVTTSVGEGVKILLSVMFGVGWVAIYDLCDKLVNLGKSLSSSVVGPLLPAFADLQAGRETARERELFVHASKALAIISCSTFAFLAVLAEPILLAWTAQDVAAAALALQVLAVGDVIMLQTGVVSANLRARGAVMLEFTCAIVATAVIVVAVIPLGHAFDFQGIIVARLLSQVVAGIWYLRAYFRESGMSEREYVSGTGLPRVVIGVGVAAGVLVGGHLLLPPWLGFLPPRWAAAVEVAVLGLPYAAVLAAMIFNWVLAPAERELLLATVRRKLGRA